MMIEFEEENLRATSSTYRDVKLVLLLSYWLFKSHTLTFADAVVWWEFSDYVKAIL